MFGSRCFAKMKSAVQNLAQGQEGICIKLLQNYLLDKGKNISCPPHFDGSYCWPSTLRMTFAKISCPIKGYEHKAIMRFCTNDIRQITSLNKSVAKWEDASFHACPSSRARIGNIGYHLFALSARGEDSSYMNWWHDKISIIDQIGYFLSIVSLVFALSIFAKFSQLQDTRVKVHINLFIAVLLQCLLSLTQNFLYGCRIYYTILVNTTGFDKDSSEFCRALMTISHYFELTVFMWVLIESWYFYTFIVRAPLNDSLTIKPHILAGWGLPLIVVIPWVIAHTFSTQSNFCWVDIDLKINILAIPILLIVLVIINLCFFILNVRIIFIKMNYIYSKQKRKHYWQWIKSSMMLVPLFGTYDIIYGVWPWIEDEKVKIGFLLVVRLICSFQGLTIAALYCFLNGEVQKEVKRAWNNWKLKKEIESGMLKHQSSTETLNKIKLDKLTDRGSYIDFKLDDSSTYI